MRSLNIVMFTTFYPPYSFGGDAMGVQRMARALVARGHDVTVVHDEDSYLILGGKPAASEPMPDGVRRIGLRSRHGLLSNLLTQQLGRPFVHAPRIREILGERNPDILWYNNTSLIGGPGLLPMGDGLKLYEAHEHWLVCPTHVLWRHGRELCDRRECLRCVLSYKRPPQLWRYTGMLDRALDHVDLIVAKSEFSRAKHKEFGLRQEMEVLPYFLPDLENLAEPYTGHPRPYFLFVGRLEKIKGLQDVFPAMGRYSDADLLIIGDGDYASELKRLAAGNSRIQFLGRKSPEELDAYYRGALGLIVPSVCYETFGIILIESFRLGTPVIARRLGPFPEIVERAGGGALFTTEDELLDAMRSLQGDPERRQAQSDSARTVFAKVWREDRVLEAYGSALARAAHRKGDQDLATLLEAGALDQGPGQAA
ncbi:N-acetyl-alpha-D-glucosaminyl L-malate synthase [Defluviimonas aquaemixtae]|uniref:N-acetyl-alpha-D-glucosaminyl L-malate synthase n=1 Tax=Albidovulum aquaemixtae TaxID=1542388 RepID=A0A2R8B2M4_9RHOB|nr:glycosyltransferase family 4 protein [Defluviimonas aquaemixtae]SPH16822.1 N-acetyl-alpha-D-glucosaminyl L-malate synthase [Defluviimonas aquaemixtae]